MSDYDMNLWNLSLFCVCVCDFVTSFILATPVTIYPISLPSSGSLSGEESDEDDFGEMVSGQDGSTKSSNVSNHDSTHDDSNMRPENTLIASPSGSNISTTSNERKRVQFQIADQHGVKYMKTDAFAGKKRSSDRKQYPAATSSNNQGRDEQFFEPIAHYSGNRFPRKPVAQNMYSSARAHGEFSDAPVLDE